MAHQMCRRDPMECLFEAQSSQQHSIFKRAPPADGTTPAPGESTNKTVVIAAATAGTIVLLLTISIFYCCMRKRRASRRIGQLQRFLPTFMDQEKTEKYFQKRSSSSLITPASPVNEKGLTPPSNAHHRTRSAPIAFTKGVTDHRNRQLERDGSMGQFQQISLISEETIVEKDESDPKRSLSGKSARTRATTVASPAVVKSSLHRSVSLNKHSNHEAINSRSSPVEEELPETPGLQDKFAEGESLMAPNRFSAYLDFSNENNRFSAQSMVDFDPSFDPSRFSSASVMFDAKRLSNVSTASSESDSSTSSDEFRKSLPPHQQQPSFHSHLNSPVERSRDATTELPVQLAINHPSYIPDKQELDEDEQYAPQPQYNYNAVQNQQAHYYPQLQQNSPIPTPMQMPVPMPMSTPPLQMPEQAVGSSGSPRRSGVPLHPSIKLTRPHGGQEMSLVAEDESY
ncbi:hypothetical protein BGZ76_010445 [Entomortierella beljakovae]|nr:hypothetical protein BGZ76_010445 [Entomortierella beljakovae]